MGNLISFLIDSKVNGAVGHTRGMIQTVKSEKNDFDVFSGYDDHLPNDLSLGGDGAITLTSSFAPELSVGIYQAFNKSNFGQTIELHPYYFCINPIHLL